MKLYKVEFPDGGAIEVSGGPGDVAKAIEGHIGKKQRGKGNIIPQIAKLKSGGVVDLDAGYTITCLGEMPDGEEVDETEEDKDG